MLVSVPGFRGDTPHPFFFLVGRFTLGRCTLWACAMSHTPRRPAAPRPPPRSRMVLRRLSGLSPVRSCRSGGLRRCRRSPPTRSRPQTTAHRDRARAAGADARRHISRVHNVSHTGGGAAGAGTQRGTRAARHPAHFAQLPWGMRMLAEDGHTRTQGSGGTCELRPRGLRWAMR